jgi:hypothetical protein
MRTSSAELPYRNERIDRTIPAVLPPQRLSSLRKVSSSTKSGHPPMTASSAPGCKQPGTPDAACAYPRKGCATAGNVPWHSDQPVVAVEPYHSRHAPRSAGAVGRATQPLDQDRNPDVEAASRASCRLANRSVRGPVARSPRCCHQGCVCRHPPSGADAAPDLEAPTTAPSTT